MIGPVLRLLLCPLRDLAGHRAALVQENLALRHQLAVLKRERARPDLNDVDRAFWGAMDTLGGTELLLMEESQQLGAHVLALHAGLNLADISTFQASGGAK